MSTNYTWKQLGLAWLGACVFVFSGYILGSTDIADQAHGNILWSAVVAAGCIGSGTLGHYLMRLGYGTKTTQDAA